MIINSLKKDAFYVLVLIILVYLLSKPAFYLYLNISHNNYNEIDSIFDLEHSFPHRHFFNFLVYLIKYFFLNKISIEIAHIVLVNISVIFSIIIIYSILKIINSKFTFLATGSIVLTYPFIGSLSFPIHQDILVIFFCLVAYYFIKKNIYLCNVFIFLALLIHELALFSIPILFYLQIENRNNFKKIIFVTLFNIFLYACWVLYAHGGFTNFFKYFFNVTLHYKENYFSIDSIIKWHRDIFGTQYRIAYIGNFFSFKALWLLVILSFTKYRKIFFRNNFEFFFYLFITLGYLSLSFLYPADDTRLISTLLFIVFISLIIKMLKNNKGDIFFLIFLMQIILPNLTTYWEIYPINPIILKFIFFLI
jgi:hypothetical protein